MRPDSNIPTAMQCQRGECGNIRQNGYTLCVDHNPAERCALVFRSPACSYVSADEPLVTSCDKKPATCKGLDNFERYCGPPPYGAAAVEAEKPDPERKLIAAALCEAYDCPHSNRPSARVFPSLCAGHADKKVRRQAKGNGNPEPFAVERNERGTPKEIILPMPPKPTGEELVERVRTFVLARIGRGHDRDCTRTVLMLLLAGSGREEPTERIDAVCDCGLREMREVLEP